MTQDEHVRLNPGMPWQKQNSTRRLFTSKLDLKFEEETIKMLHLVCSLYGAENWTVREVDQKYLESFEMWCRRRMEIRRTEHVRNEEVLQTVKEGTNTLQKEKEEMLTALITSCVGTAF
jgi:hypothetical protein